MSITAEHLPQPTLGAGPGTGLARLNRRRLLGLLACLAVCVLVVIASLGLGVRSVAWSEVFDALFRFDGSPDQLVIRELRVPRAALGVLAGAALGVSGTLMQAITRNPLADPGLLGVSSGAALAIVTGIALLGVTSPSRQVWLGFLGAATVSILVYLLGSLGRGGATPVRLTLAGAAMASLLGSLTMAILMTDLETFDEFRFWLVGSLAGRDPEVVTQVGPFIVAGLILAMLLATPLNTLALGDDTARALGTRVGPARSATAAGIAILCGAATAACGPVVFVGLVIPHMARRICGPDHRWLLPYAALLGVIALLGCDVVGRLVARPGEIQVGITTALLGGMVFVSLVRRTRLAQL
jgi:iron complex transport system permease protein